MIDRIFTCGGAAAFAFCLVMAVPVAAVAQETTPFAPSTLVVTAADGTESQYQVTDVSAYLSTSPAYDDVPASTSLSLSITTISPVDAALLEWAAQTSLDSKELRGVKVSVGVTNPDGKAGELVYELTDASVNSISATNSTLGAPSLSLTLDASKLAINGVAMN